LVRLPHGGAWTGDALGHPDLIAKMPIDSWHTQSKPIVFRGFQKGARAHLWPPFGYFSAARKVPRRRHDQSNVTARTRPVPVPDPFPPRSAAFLRKCSRYARRAPSKGNQFPFENPLRSPRGLGRWARHLDLFAMKTIDSRHAQCKPIVFRGFQRGARAHLWPPFGYFSAARKVPRRRHDQSNVTARTRPVPVPDPFPP
jgi:hypothetical protein